MSLVNISSIANLARKPFPVRPSPCSPFFLFFFFFFFFVCTKRTMVTIVFHRNKIKQRATVRLTARGRVPTFCSLLFPRWWKPVQFPRVRRGNYSKTEIVARGENGWRSDAKTFHGPFTADQLPRGNCHPLKSPHTDPISFPRFFPVLSSATLSRAKSCTLSYPDHRFTQSNGLIVDR